MSKIKQSFKEKALSKNPDLVAEFDGESYLILWKAKNGTHTLGIGKDEDGAWKSCAVNFYGLK